MQDATPTTENDAPRMVEKDRRPWTDDVVEGSRTTITIKRACNGCGRQIGDATENELLHAVAGLPLPDVRDECGCPSEKGDCAQCGDDVPCWLGDRSTCSLEDRVMSPETSDQHPPT